MIEGVDAAISSIVFLGAGIFTAFTLENRVKRRKILDAIHELRVLAHIIDMHQFAKDPDVFVQAKAGLVIDPQEAADPAEALTLTPFDTNPENFSCALGAC